MRFHEVCVDKKTELTLVQVLGSALTRDGESLGGSRVGTNQSLYPPHRYHFVKMNIKVSPDILWKDFLWNEHTAMPPHLSIPGYSDEQSILCSCTKVRLGIAPNDIHRLDDMRL